MRRTKENAEQTRTAILDTAERLLCEKGVTSTTLETISREAGVTRGAFYWHFKDRLDLLNALRERCTPPFEAILRTAAQEGHPDPLGLLEQAGLEVIESFEADEHRQRLFQIMAAVPTDASLASFRDGNEDVFDDLRRLTDQAERLGLLNSNLTSQEAAVLMISTMTGLLSEWLRSGKSFPLAELGKRLFLMHLNIIRGSPPHGV